MTDSAALGLNLGVLGVMLLAAPFLPINRTWSRSLAVAFALGLWGRYFIWRLMLTRPPVLASGEGAYYLLALAAEGLSILSMGIFYVTLTRTTDRSGEADRLEAWLRGLPPDALPTVDVFLPTYNEGPEVIERGIVAAKALDYPRFKVWVLDDGRRDWLRDLCAAKGVGYIRRADNRHAKAGNVNHALTVTSGDLVATFDADFAPYRNYLYRTVGFLLVDQRVAVVQTPQHFFNVDVFQLNLGLAGAMQDNERAWYDVQLPSRDAWDCAFWCGSCSLLRRSALESIGGVPTDSVTEDVLATLTMFRQGLICRYLNERLSIGLMPEDLQALTIQRQRWARGAIQTLFLRSGPLGPGLTFIQRLLFVQYHYVVDFPCRLLLLLLPILYLWTGLAPFRVQSMAELLAYQLPPVIATTGLSWWIFRNARAPLVSAAASYYIAGKVFPSVLATLIRPFGAPFKVTPKGKPRTDLGDPGAFYFILTLILLSVGGIAYSQFFAAERIDAVPRSVATLWVFANLLLLGVMLMCVGRAPRRRGEQRFPIDLPGFLSVDGSRHCCRVVDLSLTGALIETSQLTGLGDAIELLLEEVGTLPATVVRNDKGRIGLKFGELAEDVRDRLITSLYSSGRTNAANVVDRVEVFQSVVRRLLVGDT